MRSHGLDYSKWAMDWYVAEKTPLPVDFAIQRVSWAGNTDKRYDSHSKRLNQVDMRGAYHYYSSGVPWLQQAELFLKLVTENPHTNYHMMWLDYEVGYNKLTYRTSEEARKIVEYCASRFPGRVGIYANPNTIVNYLDPFSSWMLDWPLWVAQYFWVRSPDNNPSLKVGTRHAKRADSAWSVFQYTDRGDAPAYGIAGKKAVDLDVYNGTVEDMKAWLEIKPPEENRYVTGWNSAIDSVVKCAKDKKR